MLPCNLVSILHAVVDIVERNPVPYLLVVAETSARHVEPIIVERDEHDASWYRTHDMRA